jgi:integrase
MKFSEIFDHYYTRHVLVRNKREANARYFYKNHGVFFADRDVETISRRDVQDWFDEIAKEKGEQGATRALNLLSAVINWALKRELIPDIKNPCIHIDRFPQTSRSRFLSSEEFQTFINALENESPQMRDFFWLCLLTGARKGNVQSMRWSELDLGLKIWKIPANKFKNGDDQNIPLIEQALNILEHRKIVAVKSEWVFPSTGKTGHLMEPKRAWTRILKRAGLDDLRIHDLRRTMGSYLAINGASSYVIGQVLGHKDARSTATYARLNLTVGRSAMEGVSAQWSDFLDQPLDARAMSPVKTEPKVTPQSTAKNAEIKITGATQILVEAKLLQTMNQPCNKKALYKKLGSQFSVNARELDRILAELIGRGIIYRRTNDHFNSFDYCLVAEDVAS